MSLSLSWNMWVQCLGQACCCPPRLEDPIDDVSSSAKKTLVHRAGRLDKTTSSETAVPCSMFSSFTDDISGTATDETLPPASTDSMSLSITSSLTGGLFAGGGALMSTTLALTAGEVLTGGVSITFSALGLRTGEGSKDKKNPLFTQYQCVVT